MGYLKERVSYLRGLAEGIKVGESTDEGKLMSAMIEVMDDFAAVIDEIEELQNKMCEEIEDIQDDLADIEGDIMEDDFDDCIGLNDIECPNCNQKINLEEQGFDEDQGTIKCPNCNEDVEIEWDYCCDDECGGECDENKR